MLKRLCLLLVILLLALTARSVVAQTSAGLESKYGSPLNAYVIRPGLLMTAKHAVRGQVCEMSIIEAHTPGSNISRRTPLTFEIVPALIDELVPEGERGNKLRSYGLAQAQGMTSQLFYNFENVSIELVQSLLPSKGWSDSVLMIKWNDRVCK